MKKFISVLKLSIYNTFEYRNNYIISCLINILSTVILIFLWRSIFLFDNKIKSYNLSSMLIYIFIVNTIFDMIDTSYIASIVSDDIRLGQLNFYLIRPYSYLKYQFASAVGNKITKIPVIFVLNGIMGIILLFYLNEASLKLNLSIISIIFFILFLFLSFLWCFLLDFFLGVLGFWMENPWAIFFIKGEIISFLSGVAIPIDLFPTFLKKMLDYLPFKYYVFFPYKVLIGEVTYKECVQNLFIFIAWIFFIIVITNIVWQKSIKTYTAVGG